MTDPLEEAARWAQIARRQRLPRTATQALLLAIRNGADADYYVADGRVHVFLHLPGADLVDALVADRLARAGFVFDEESGDWRFVR